MNQVFWIGIYPGIGAEMIDYMLSTLYAIVGRTPWSAAGPPAGLLVEDALAAI